MAAAVTLKQNVCTVTSNIDWMMSHILPDVINYSRLENWCTQIALGNEPYAATSTHKTDYLTTWHPFNKVTQNYHNRRFKHRFQ